MIDFDGADSIGELEALVLASGGYVRASDDLRPRVLETARMELRERRVQHAMRRTLFCVLLVGACTSAQVSVDSSHDFPKLAAAVSRIEAPAAAVPMGDKNDVGWIIVDAFTELRRQQAEILPIEL